MLFVVALVASRVTYLARVTTHQNRVEIHTMSEHRRVHLVYSSLGLCLLWKVRAGRHSFSQFVLRAGSAQEDSLTIVSTSCTTNANCLTTQYCQKKECAASVGTCATKPKYCPLLFVRNSNLTQVKSQLLLTSSASAPVEVRARVHVRQEDVQQRLRRGRCRLERPCTRRLRDCPAPHSPPDRVSPLPTELVP